jgi:hypothetical protein
MQHDFDFDSVFKNLSEAGRGESGERQRERETDRQTDRQTER